MDKNIIRAMALIRAYVIEAKPNVLPFEVKVVWYCKVLQNWKALLITDLKDNRYYEITYDGVKACAYIDAYEKIENIEIPIEKFPEVKDAPEGANPFWPVASWG